jgi:3-oxoacyl-[acyl-carrier-protein] synthase III
VFEGEEQAALAAEATEKAIQQETIQHEDVHMAGEKKV